MLWSAVFSFSRHDFHSAWQQPIRIDSKSDSPRRRNKCICFFQISDSIKWFLGNMKVKLLSLERYHAWIITTFSTTKSCSGIFRSAHFPQQNILGFLSSAFKICYGWLFSKRFSFDEHITRGNHFPCISPNTNCSSENSNTFEIFTITVNCDNMTTT